MAPNGMAVKVKGLPANKTTKITVSPQKRRRELTDRMVSAYAKASSQEPMS